MRLRLAALLGALVFGTCAALAQANKDDAFEGGIVGTGIVGTITELGSIYVNGQHILFADEQLVSSPLGARPASALVPGETVVVEATRNGDDWRATAISAYLPLIGPVDAVSDDHLTVMGIVVATTAEILANTGAGAGDWIAVSGLWRGDSVIASRIEIVEPLSLASIVGTYQQGPDIDRVGPVPMLGIKIEHARPLDVLTVQGTPTVGGLAVETVAVGLFTGPVGEVLFEGYLSQPTVSGAYTVEGSGFLAYVERPMRIDPNRALFCGRPSGGAGIERVLDLPEAAEPRDAILKRFRGDPDPCGRDTTGD